MTDTERQQLAGARAARERERGEALQAATNKARDRWRAGLRVERHPYLEAKGIGSDEAFRRDKRGNLMTAMYDGAGQVRNVQTITARWAEAVRARRTGLRAVLTAGQDRSEQAGADRRGRRDRADDV